MRERYETPSRAEDSGVASETSLVPQPRTSHPGALAGSSERGKTTIADSIVAQVARIATREVPGVHDLVDHGSGGLLSGLSHRASGETRVPGVQVKIEDHEVAISLQIAVSYGVSIPQVTEALRSTVVEHVERMTGLTVREVNIDVAKLMLPEDAPPAEAEEQPRE